jgi:hypothetical protein
MRLWVCLHVCCDGGAGCLQVPALQSTIVLFHCSLLMMMQPVDVGSKISVQAAAVLCMQLSGAAAA